LSIPIETLSRRFRRFGERECQHASPLYARLAVGIADDRQLLAIAAAAQSHPVPNLFLAAVHYLLLKDRDHPLAALYPDLALTPQPARRVPSGWRFACLPRRGGGEQSDPFPLPRTTREREPSDPFPLFRAFCLEHADQIRALLAARRVQTNEVRRCACLLPAFVCAALRSPGRPLALVEVGASAGFNLLWDRYGYDYGTGQRYGNPGSPVQLACELRGGRQPPLAPALPEVAFRVGIDLNPIDARDEDAMLWLRALIWPEQHERAALLDRAIEVARREPPRLAGDALDLLPDAIRSAPADAALCVFHTFTLNQFSATAREQYDQLIAAQAASRNLCEIAIEWREPYPSVALTTFESGARSEQTLAHCDAHGAWLEWL